MKNKGFTLIELLAVILILGIIALIAIPTVSSVVEQSRKGAFESTARNIVKAVEEGCMSAQLSGDKYPGIILINEGVSDYQIDLKGDLPDEAYIYIETVGCTVAMKARSGNYMAVKEYENDSVNANNYAEDAYKLNSTFEIAAYIESTGTQYIDTEVTNSPNLRVILDFEAKSASVQFFYGARPVASTSTFSFLTQSVGNFRVDYSNKSSFYGSLDYEKRYSIDQNKNTYTIKKSDGQIRVNGTITDYDDFNSNLSFYLFAINQNGTAYKNSLMKVYSFKMYNNDVLVRDYIPVRLSNGNGALYDKVNNKIYENKGTGIFIVG